MKSKIVWVIVILQAGSFLAGCREAIPIVTALSSSKKSDSGTKHFFFTKNARVLSLYELDANSITAAATNSFTLSHDIADAEIIADRRLLVDGGAGDLYIYDIEKVGSTIALTFKSSSMLPPGDGTTTTNSVCASLDGSAVQLYQFNGGSVLYSFNVNTDGTSNYIAAVSAPSYLVGCAATNHFVYAAGFTGESVKAYSIDASTKALSLVSAYTFSQSGPSHLYMTTDLKYLFVTEQKLNTLAVFSLDATNGALTKLHSAEACPTPNWVQGFNGDAHILINCQSSGQAIMPFNADFGQTGTPSRISTTSTGFYRFSERQSVLFQYRSSNVDLKRVHADGTLSNVSQTLSTVGAWARPFTITF